MIVLGRIVAPFGVQGWVKVHPFGDEPDAWAGMPRWWLAVSPDAADWQPYALQQAGAHGKGLIAKLAGVEGRDAAEAIDGYYVGAPREALPKNAADEYYWADLVGLQVVNEEGVRLGQVASLLSSGAHEVLCVRDGEQERLLPFVAKVVKGVDVGGGVIRVDWGADW
ncbi:MAG TPA: ribosome maturation factor RimM [Rhodocyclaceae bacterium]|nr:ribosome maturation factor RimM [Rhodocyclaceae bacterium]